MAIVQKEHPRIRHLAEIAFTQNDDVIALLRLLNRKEAKKDKVVYTIKLTSASLLDDGNIKSELLESGFAPKIRLEANDTTYDATLKVAFNMLSYLRRQGLVKNLWEDHGEQGLTAYGAMGLTRRGRAVLSVCEDMAKEETAWLEAKFSNLRR